MEVDAQGRVTIPKTLGDRLGIHGGSRLLVREEEGRLIFEDREHALHRLQVRMSSLRSASGASTRASDQLIADRRAEAARETSEHPH